MPYEFECASLIVRDPADDTLPAFVIDLLPADPTEPDFDHDVPTRVANVDRYRFRPVTIPATTSGPIISTVQAERAVVSFAAAQLEIDDEDGATGASEWLLSDTDAQGSAEPQRLERREEDAEMRIVSKNETLDVPDAAVPVVAAALQSFVSI